MSYFWTERRKERKFFLKNSFIKAGLKTETLDLCMEQSKILQCGKRVHENLTDSGILCSKVITYLRTVEMLSVSFQTQIQQNFGFFIES